MDTIVQIPISQIRPNDYNPNVVADNIMRQLVKSITREGVQNPVSVRKGVSPEGEEIYVIIDGEHRWRALSELGSETCPCVIKEKDKFDAMIETINMNKLRGEFDTVKLAQVLTSLQEKYSLEELEDLIGYTDQELLSYKEMLSHDFGDFADEPNNLGELLGNGKDEMSSLVNKFEVEVSLQNLDWIESAIKMIDMSDRGVGLANICKEYLELNFPTEFTAVKNRSKQLKQVENNPLSGVPLEESDPDML